MTGRFAILLLAAWPVVAQESTLTHPQVTTTERLPFDAGGTIRIEHSYGDLNVEGWDRSDVEITLIKSLPYGFKDKKPGESMRRLEEVKVVAKRSSDTELAITTTLPSHGGILQKLKAGVGLEYRIHAPQGTRLVIHHGTGMVSVSDVTGDIEATCHRGDIMLMLPEKGTYSIDAESKLGTVISQFDGTPRLRKYRLGERYQTGSSSQKLLLRVGFGGITLMANPPR